MAVLAVAYGSAAPSLAVAEFAPAARQAPEAPPTTSGAGAGTSAGSRGRRAPTTTTAAAATVTTAPGEGGGAVASTTRVGRARPCYGNPPRQLPDSRSPTCIPTVFEGDNGGATTAGVTGTAIRVAVVSGGPDHEAGMKSLFEYMNRHYEFYGRRLEPVIVSNPGTYDPGAQRAFADDLAARDIFAVLAKPMNSWWTSSFFQGLARHGVLSVVDGIMTAVYDRDLLDPFHPYVWSVYPSIEQQQRHVVSFVCQALAGRPPTHATELSQAEPRRFGVVAVGDYVVPRTKQLIEGLESCGATPAATTDIVFTSDGDDGIRNGLRRLQAAGVSTLICACADYRWERVRPALDGISWSPELLMPTGLPASIEESNMRGRLTPKAKTRIFGLQPYPKVVPPQAQRWFTAMLEVDPTTDVSEGYYLMSDYEQLLVLAAGIQAAGPQLTAQAFGQGLMSASFSNSDASRAPDYLPAVGFGAGDHSFYDDYALVSWSNTAEPFGWNSLPNVLGSWCYLDRGARYQVGQYPGDADRRFFSPNEPCR